MSYASVPLASDTTSKAILNEVTGIRAIMDAQVRDQTIDSWESLKRLVDRGVMKDEFPVGSVISETWHKTDELSYSAPWDVVHYDVDGSAYLKQHYAIPTGIPFDAPEAIYYVTEAKPAGQYYISIGFNYGDGWHSGDHINFTTTVPMEVGDQIVISTGTDNKIDPTNGKTWNLYAKGSTTSKDSGTTSNSDVGVELGSTSTEGVEHTNGQVNAPQRIVYGYNRWSQSAIRQYLNSSAESGSWWTPANGWDRPPAELASVRGWLAGCSSEFLDILTSVDVVTAINTVEGSTETTETTKDKIFLPSLQQMHVSPQLANVEGDDWDYYKELATEIGLSGRFSTGHAYDVLKHYAVDNTTSSVSVWLRSASRGYSHSPWFVTYSGNVTYGNACYTYRGCPACKIEKSS